MVLGGGSCSKGHWFESRDRILDGHFFTYVFVAKFVMCYRRYLSTALVKNHAQTNHFSNVKRYDKIVFENDSVSEILALSN